jgi:uncharacterized membrane protein YvbJ
LVKICPKCGVINENNFVCCKNCGEIIKEVSIMPVKKLTLKEKIEKNWLAIIGFLVMIDLILFMVYITFTYVSAYGTPLYRPKVD